MTERQPKAPTFDSNRAVFEKFLIEKGESDVRRCLAAELRKSSPKREVLDIVARLLCPLDGDSFELVFKRRGRGNPNSRPLESDIKVVLEVLNREVELLDQGVKRGVRKRAIGTVAAQHGLSDSRVRQIVSRVTAQIPKITA
jgi:hypothetical protein